MTDLVASKVAQDAQLNLLALRPQVQPQERQQNPIQLAQVSVDADARRGPNPAEESAAHSDRGGTDAERESRRQAELTGPSRARLEVRTFDVGKTPAEVVGTRDTVLRFDGNGDGRIDLIESRRASRARVDGGSYAGLYGDGIDPTPVVAVRADTAQPRIAPDGAEQVPVDVTFGPPRTDAEFEAKKFSNKALADQGYSSGEAEVAPKYYGRGAEPVVGQFTAQAPEPPQKYAERAAELERGRISEDGSGERKFYDKVPQAEAQADGGSDAPPQRSYYERAQDVAPEPAPGAPTPGAPTPGAPTPGSPANAPAAPRAVAPAPPRIVVTA
ncbi:MAG: hypothetical protein SFV21_13975 [Rhodospirillaceae bacterium]|nr:hypothetical protein [Rhodospirillaceae bacterium]